MQKRSNPSVSLSLSLSVSRLCTLTLYGLRVDLRRESETEHRGQSEPLFVESRDPHRSRQHLQTSEVSMGMWLKEKKTEKNEEKLSRFHSVEIAES